MTLIAKNTTVKREPIPAGSYIGRCVGLVDLGSQYTEQFEKWYPKVCILWELPDFTYEDGDGNTRARMISGIYTNGLSEKGNLRKLLEAWRGKPFSQEELKGFDLRVLLGLPCMVSIVHQQSGDNVYENINAVMKMMAGVPEKPQVNPLLLFDLDSQSVLKDLELLPDWLADKVRNSKEWQEIEAGTLDESNEPLLGEDAEEDLPF